MHFGFFQGEVLLLWAGAAWLPVWQLPLRSTEGLYESLWLKRDHCKNLLIYTQGKITERRLKPFTIFPGSLLPTSHSNANEIYSPKAGRLLVSAFNPGFGHRSNVV